MTRTAGDFAAGVLDGFRSGLSENVSFTKSLRASSTAADVTRPMGHPDFADLGLDESGHCDAAVVFLDLVAFTARTFWDEPGTTVSLARAVLTQVVEVVYDYGGYVLGLRGDGVFACFGAPGSDPDVDVALSLAACAFALDATQGALNNLLRLSGIAPVQLRAGADHGRLDFVRQGSSAGSEVNVISFPANFASKCEKHAKSWEIVAGEGFVRHVGNPALRVEHPESPKTYERDHQRKSYRFYDIRWRSITSHAAEIPAELDGAPTSHIHVN